MATQQEPIAWLLLRDGHAVPIIGLHPDNFKETREDTVVRPGNSLKAQTRLNAIVDCLGFDGDFGDYKSKHYPAIQTTLQQHGMTHRVNLFYSLADPEIGFGVVENKRRALADRIFISERPRPTKIFLGYDYDWQPWTDLFGQFGSPIWTSEIFIPTSIEATRQWVYSRGVENLISAYNFHSDLLLQFDEPLRLKFTDEFYFPKARKPEEREKAFKRSQQTIQAFRWLLEQSTKGWVEVVPLTKHLVALKGPDGAYDLLWKDLRTYPPTESVMRGLTPNDTPSWLREQSDRLYHYRGWEELDRHESEIAYYETGALENYPGADEIMEQYLRRKGKLPTKQPATSVPAGFKLVRLPEEDPLYISELITIQQFRVAAEEANYWERREGDSWEQANPEGSNEDIAVGVTYFDALAYCSWLEKKLGVAVRLLSNAEHRNLRPFASDHYKNQAYGNFLWEHKDPLLGLLPSVEWSKDKGVWPPAARWITALPLVRYQELTFIDAWDAYEWVLNRGIAWAAGRYWEGALGNGQQWVAYKRAKVGFRVVIEAGDAQ